MKQIILAAALLAGAVGCASNPGTSAYEDEQYYSLEKSLTRSTDQYSGIYQTFQADFTFENTALSTAMVAKRARFLQWDAQKAQKERDRSFQELSTESKFFLRFYTPDSDWDDLSLGTSIWKIYLDVNGSRYEGKATKMSEKLVELHDLFPKMDRFSTPYLVTFPLPSSGLENTHFTITLTSAAGKAVFSF